MNAERTFSSHEILVKLESYCAYQERSTLEVQRKLNEWGRDQKESLEIIDKLRSKGFLNDKRFAESFVSGKYRFKKWGKIKLRFELKQKGISDELIRKALETIDQDEYFSILKELAERKCGEIKEKDSWKKRAKLHRFLAAKGYESDLISEVLDFCTTSE